MDGGQWHNYGKFSFQYSVNLKSKFLILFLVGFHFLSLAQKDEVSILMSKGDSLQHLDDWSQARYFYSLANKKCLQNESCTYLISQDIKNRINKIDSLESYHHEDEFFVKLIVRADSLLAVGQEIYAMKTFDDASTLHPSLVYPKDRITHIINTSKTIQEKLLVLQANQKRQRYNESFNQAKKLEEEGNKIEAYYRYLSIAQEFHNDQVAIQASERIYMKIAEDLKSFENTLNQGNEYYLSGKYSKSKTFFETALDLNGECALCEQRLKYLNYYIEVQQFKKGDYELQKQLAFQNYLKGKYNDAFYQYVALSKKNPSDAEVLEKIEEIDYVLQSELDEKIKTFNADLLLERANEFYMNKEFTSAVELYLKLEERYKDVINYGSFVELRISECIRELEEN